MFSPLPSVISGIGELDLGKEAPRKTEPSPKVGPYPDCPFLLLDVRDRYAYEQCHIVGGKGTDSTDLMRLYEPWSTLLLVFGARQQSLSCHDVFSTEVVNVQKNVSQAREHLLHLR